MTTSTGYTIASGAPTRKVKGAAISAISIGPALIVVVDWLLTLAPTQMPANVTDAVNVIIEAVVMITTAYLTAPGAQDQVAPVPPAAVPLPPTK